MTEKGLKARIRDRVLSEAVPVVRDPAERVRDILESIAAIERHADCTKTGIRETMSYSRRGICAISRSSEKQPGRFRKSTRTGAGSSVASDRRYAERPGTWIL